MYQYDFIFSEEQFNGTERRYVRKTRRKYEEKNKEKRKQASGNFGTMIPRALYDEINAFLEENGITKVRLIKEGYEALKNMKKDGKL